MRIFLSNGEYINASDIATMVLRHDCVPVPVTLELVVNDSQKVRGQLDVGKVITLDNGINLTIVKSQTWHGNMIKDGMRLGANFVIAVLSGCEALVHTTNRAINLKNTNLAQIYHACGCRVNVSQDISVDNFVCFKGVFASTRIMWSLQKEAAWIVYDHQSHTIKIKRIADLLEGAKQEYDRSYVSWYNHAQSDQDIVARHLSIDKNGTDIVGQAGVGRIDYTPRSNQRELNNLSRVIVSRGTIERGTIDDKLLAGHGIVIDGKPYLVMTSAIKVDTGSFGGNSGIVMKSWFGDLQQVGEKHRQILDNPVVY